MLEKFIYIHTEKYTLGFEWRQTKAKLLAQTGFEPNPELSLPHPATVQ